MMTYNHAAVINRNVEEANRFYRDILGFKKSYTFKISQELARDLFNVKQSVEVHVYTAGEVKIEVFLISDFQPPIPNIPHLCVNVENFNDALKLAKDKDVKIITGEHMGKKVHFFKDFAGNMLEIKKG
jgi:catechol 2,3-dioxygenase-like lactoylglutathione lyase family enzyme